MAAVRSPMHIRPEYATDNRTVTGPRDGMRVSLKETVLQAFWTLSLCVLCHNLFINIAERPSGIPLTQNSAGLCARKIDLACLLRAQKNKLGANLCTCMEAKAMMRLATSALFARQMASILTKRVI